MFARFRYQPQAKSSINATTTKTTPIEQQSAACLNNSKKKTKVILLNESKWQERWHSICVDCFEKKIKCIHYEEKRLRLLIVGHNPSSHAWSSGFSYSNPSNRMWKLLTGDFFALKWEGILPSTAVFLDQNSMPFQLGIGMTSIGLEPGNDAASYGKDIMKKWKHDFYRRLEQHVSNVCRVEHQHNDGIKCRLSHGPLIIAFSGKRQFAWMFSPPLSKIENYGKQSRLPPDWPLQREIDSEVWVLPSSSGRAAMSNEVRALPYQQLAQRLHQIPWEN